MADVDLIRAQRAAQRRLERLAVQEPSSWTAYGHVRATNGSTACSNGGATYIVVSTEDYDDLSEYDPATGIFTASAAGVYHLATHIYFSATGTLNANSYAALTAVVSTDGGTNYYQRSQLDFLRIQAAGAYATLSLRGAASFKLSASHKLKLQVTNNTGVTLTVYNDSVFTNLSIDRLF